MARRPRGEAEIERLLGLRHLQTITGAAADGEPLLEKAGAPWRPPTPSPAPTLTAPSSSLTTQPATRPRPSLPNKVCGQPQPVAMSPSSRPSVPSSATASVGSASCAGAAMNSSTRAPAPPLLMSMRRTRPSPNPAASFKRPSSS